MRTFRSIDKSQRTALYRLYAANGGLLYVGIAFDPRRRWYHHAGEKAWWDQVARKEVTWHESRTEAEAAERSAIRSERPLYNIAGVAEPMRMPPRPPAQVVELSVEILSGLKRALRNYRRYKDARTELHEAIKGMSATGKGPKEITFLIDHEYDVAHVSRIIHGKTSTRRRKPDA